MTQEDLEEYNQQLKEKRDKYREVIESFPKNQEDYSTTDWITYNDYYEVQNILRSIQVELVRREQRLEDESLSSLQEIAHDAYRAARRMQNYDWDVVERSSDENQEGFWRQVDFLETLEAAANLESDRREYMSMHG